MHVGETVYRWTPRGQRIAVEARARPQLDYPYHRMRVIGIPRSESLQLESIARGYVTTPRPS